MKTRSHNSPSRWRCGALSALAVLALTACGGGEGGDAALATSLKAAGPQPAELPALMAKSHGSGNDARTFIVLLRESGVSASAIASSAVRPFGGQVQYVYSSAVHGFAASVPQARADDFVDAMQSDPAVDLVEADQVVSTQQTVQPNATWGLDRSDQRDLPLDTRYAYHYTGAGVRAYIIDTGIFPGHTDFGGRVVAGFTAINDGRGTADCHGHGTHVAGTVGGATWGIAKQVTLVPVRVLGCSGSGSTSGVIAGIDWMTANAPLPAVANMSLGGGASTAMDTAIARATARGISIAVAAGNDNGNACQGSPARAPSALTVGATGSSDQRASFSNYGSCLDLFAPGVSIRSASHNSPTGSNLKSGTSMAAPHVAGLAALVLQAQPDASAQQVSDFIKATATPGKVTNPGPGSPNLLIYTLGTGETPPPPPPPPPPPEPVPGAVSVGALSGWGDKSRSIWRATVTVGVKNALGQAVPGALVQGGFSVGGSSASCTTAADGNCSLTSGSIAKRNHATTFTVQGISGPGLVYDPSGNVATSIVVRWNR